MDVCCTNIFKTIRLYKICKCDKTGVVICGSFNDKIYKYYKKFENNLDLMVRELVRHNCKLVLYTCYDTEGISVVDALSEMPNDKYKLPCFEKHNLHDSKQMYQYFKFLYPLIMLNVKKLADNLYYDEPFFHLASGNPICYWKPTFENKISKKHYIIEDNYFIYNYERNILVLFDLNKRHESVKVKERLAINLVTGKASLYFDGIVGNYFVNAILYFDNGWVLQNINKTYIHGYRNIFGAGVQ